MVDPFRVLRVKFYPESDFRQFTVCAHSTARAFKLGVRQCDMVLFDLETGMERVDDSTFENYVDGSTLAVAPRQLFYQLPGNFFSLSEAELLAVVVLCEIEGKTE
jgi:hypothetical protein